MAQDAQHNLFRLGVGCHVPSATKLQVMSATTPAAADCAVTTSSSGRSRDLLDAAGIARRKGATIAITASGSPLAQRRSRLLAADHPEDYDRYSPIGVAFCHR